MVDPVKLITKATWNRGKKNDLTRKACQMCGFGCATDSILPFGIRKATADTHKTSATEIEMKRLCGMNSASTSVDLAEVFFQMQIN